MNMLLFRDMKTTGVATEKCGLFVSETLPFLASTPDRIVSETALLEVKCPYTSRHMTDYCFAIESFPNCNYDQLRDFLVLPSKRKLQSIVSATNIDQVLEKTF